LSRAGLLPFSLERWGRGAASARGPR
jgi:hypothetical protein